MAKKKKKYSLEERVQYHSDAVDKEFEKSKNNGHRTKRAQYGLGYMQAVARGAPLDFDSRSAEYKKGVQAGLSAKKKSENLKF